MDPILDLALMFSLWDSILTSPPPEKKKERVKGQCECSVGRCWFMGREIGDSSLWLTWLMFDVVLGAAFGRYLAHIDLLIQDLHLREGRDQTESLYLWINTTHPVRCVFTPVSHCRAPGAFTQRTTSSRSLWNMLDTPRELHPSLWSILIRVRGPFCFIRRVNHAPFIRMGEERHWITLGACVFRITTGIHLIAAGKGGFLHLPEWKDQSC